MLLSFAAGAYAIQTNGELGELRWTLDADGTLTVTGAGEMPFVSHYPWENNTELRSVVIDEGITSVAVKAFYNCS